MKYESFLKWWLIFTLTTIGFIFSLTTGYAKLIWEKDASYLCAAITIIFIWFSIYVGATIYKTSKYLDMDELAYEKFLAKEELVWFVSDVCLNLGMLGTIIGFVMMLSGFETLEINNSKSIEALLSQLGKSMATALYTTMVGLVCAQILKIQNLILGVQLERFKPKYPKEIDEIK